MCVDNRFIEEETATTDDKKIKVFMAQLEHQWMLWDPSDHSCKNRNKSSNVIRGKLPSKDLGMMESLLFSYSKPK